MKIRLLTFFILSGISTQAYKLPDFEEKVFDNDKLAVNKILKGGALFSGLLSVARDFTPEENDTEDLLRTHALAIAGRLYPDSENFKDLELDLKNRGRSNARDEVTISGVSEKLTRGIRGLMAEDGNKENIKCAAFCIDIALRLDPESRFKSELEAFQKTTGKPKWKPLEGATAVPPGGGGWPGDWGGMGGNVFEERRETLLGGTAETFAGKTSEIYGLHVSTLGNGRHVGGASAVMAVALKDKSVEDIELHIDQDVGNMTGNSLEEVAKLMQIRHKESDRPSGYRVSITFEDKDQRLDGPSAGTAMSILVDSLFTGRKLDSKFACTGAITVTGKVMPIGGVAGKIRGATNKGCYLVGVPHANIKGVSDILVLDGIQKLIDIQVFSFETLDQAIEVASLEKSETVQSAIDDFAKVATLLNGDSLKGNPVKQLEKLKNSVVVNLLKDLVEKMPNHQSAKILLSVAEGEQKTALSLGGSFHQIRTITSGVARNIYGATNGQGDIDAEARKEAKEALAELEGISNKIDPRLNDYSKAMLTVVKTFSEGRNTDEKDEEFAKRLKKEWDAAQAESKKLAEDTDIQEELRN